MRNLVLLGVATFAGISAFVANYMYLSQSTQSVAYLHITKEISLGDEINETNIGQVMVSGEAITAAMKYENRSAIIGRQALRRYKPGELILVQDVSGPRADLVLEQGEKGLVLDVSKFSIEPSLIRVGDRVSFLASSPNDRNQNGEIGQIENLGEFRIVAIGDIVHVGTGLTQSSRPSVRLNTLTVAINVTAAGQLDDRAQRLIKSSDSGVLLRVLLGSSGNTR